MPEEKLDRLAVYGGKGFWIRAAYLDGFRDRSITAIVRRGDRSKPEDPRHNPLGVDLPVRFIRIPGNQAGGISPELFPDDGTTIRITGYVMKQIKDLTPDDLVGCSPDTANPELVRYHLALLENTILPAPDEVITVWRFEYR